jgi:hypothetical protein
VKIAVLTRSDDRSPKILAQSLASMCVSIGVECDIIYEIGLLIRLQPFWQPLRFPISFFKRIYSIFKFYKSINKLIRKLSTYDVIIISECTPDSFWNDYYAIERLKKILMKPILLYEVYYIGNAPTQVQKLKSANESLFERYDWHLSASRVTEIRTPEEPPWTCVGLNLIGSGLAPSVKKEFIAVVDFQQKGYEAYRKVQIKVLKELGIKTIFLEGNYSIQEIRKIYSDAAVYFMQSTEAFGLPLAECFACGTMVFTPSSSWPMSWRLDEEPQIHGEGTLGEGIFRLYRDEQDLRSQLLELMQNYDLAQTPHWVFSKFTEIYPHYYYGNQDVLKKTLMNFVDFKYQWERFCQ